MPGRAAQKGCEKRAHVRNEYQDMVPGGAPSAYRTAIDETTGTIERRARNLRNQIVFVVAVSTGVLAAVLMTWSLAAACAWLLLVPICGLFFLADSQTLNRWRAGLLAAWLNRELDFVALRETILANPMLPRKTVEAMLTTLPILGNLVAEQNILTPTRRAIAAATLAEHRATADILLINVIASAVAVVGAIAAAWSGRWAPLAVLISLALVPTARARAKSARRASCEAEVAALRSLPGFSDDDYHRLRSAIG